ncbi:MAG: hypothetical protein JWN73_2434 [Betaproteobacteria bacterium]|nr:hypothetical protein [Betaproteobacteria bacterium]
MISVRIAATAVLMSVSISASAADQTLDYAYFKERVEPIFLKKRPDHARCYACHSESNNAFHLEKLTPGSSFWSEEQSRRNFELAARVAIPGNLEASMLLKHPLAPEAGGDAYHSGGRQFANKNDPDWKILMQWVGGAKLATAAK